MEVTCSILQILKPVYDEHVSAIHRQILCNISEYLDQWIKKIVDDYKSEIYLLRQNIVQNDLSWYRARTLWALGHNIKSIGSAEASFSQLKVYLLCHCLRTIIKKELITTFKTPIIFSESCRNSAWSMILRNFCIYTTESILSGYITSNCMATISGMYWSPIYPRLEEFAERLRDSIC